ncbi:MAG TPA: bifunctional precorrin-2 dehydrogenase/sirohydrochlorin ferrochelatase [Campylobacterales bacterium]|nr:bifunctional precorrin-2 dehydrogenase/sirohydrochlorin ferrochelatase [Campylobacterales bacterium]
MKYFPAFIKLENKKILIVGGGNIAIEKIEKLLDFTIDIKVIARMIIPQMQTILEENNLLFEKRTYKKGDINSFDIVIIAVDSLKLQEEIWIESRETRILCNAVDSVDYCDFIFPSYIKEGDLTIAISTSGASPAIAKHLKLYLKKILPKSISTFLIQMKELRASLPKGKERMQLLDKKAREFFNNI